MITKSNNFIQDRIITLDERQAYKNLKSYDDGSYKINRRAEIERILTYGSSSFKTTTRNLYITKEEIYQYIDYAQILNTIHSDFNPGNFVERGVYEASFAKKVYYNSEPEFIVNLFISHHNIHAFFDGNKRTALNLFIDFMYKFTEYYIQDILVIQDAQLLYLEKEITQLEFEKIIYNEMRRKIMNTNIKCNLEGLIPRSDIEENDEEIIVSQSDRRTSINLTDLERSQFFYQQLRKPIFQRDTNQWSVARVEKLINTFLDDGLIPAIILWEDTDGYIYIIDGAHRISSLIAWVNSDYGKNNQLHDSNHQIIEEYINTQIGSYEEIKASTDEKYKPQKRIIAKRSIAVQWVTGDYEKVKESFIRINEQGVVISEDEKELIQNDMLPISKLSRAILAHGLGQSSKYQTENTKKIFDRFFKPSLSQELNNYPLAGDLNEDLVISKIYNVVKIIDNGQKLSIELLEEKVLKTLIFIQDFLNICQKIYFYGATKKFKVNSFYSFVRFSLELQENSQLLDCFLKNRKKFEYYLVENENHIQEISRKKRQAKKAYEVINLYYKTLLLSCDKDDFTEFKETFHYLNFTKEKRLTSRQKSILHNYTEYVASVPLCEICGSFIDGRKDDKKIHHCCLNT